MSPDKSLIERLREQATRAKNAGDHRDHLMVAFEAGVALDEAADRLEALTAPVEMETTAKERARFAAVAGPAAAAWADKSLSTLDRMTRSIVSVDGDALHRLLRDANKADRPAAQLRREGTLNDHLSTQIGELTAQLAAEKERADAADERAHYATGTAEANIARANEAEARVEKAEAALRAALRQVETSRPVNEDINAGSRGKTGMSHLSPYHRDVLDEQC